MILTFKQFLNEARSPDRTHQVNVMDLMYWADRNASGYLKGKRFLYRGGSGRGWKTMIGNSVSIVPRRSANTNNNYTLWMDYSGLFKDFPRRSQSFIGTDDKTTAAGFGNPCLLIVADNAKVGLVGHEDIWFVEIDPKTHMDLEEFNGNMEFALRKLGYGNAKTFDELAKSLKATTMAKLEDAADNESNEDVEKILEKVITSIYKNGCKNMFELWEKLLTPKLFPPNTTGAEVSQHPTFGEVWIEGECGFISADGSDFDEDTKKAVLDWAQEAYPHFMETLEADWNDHDFDN